jgi:hypothetical protein
VGEGLVVLSNRLFIGEAFVEFGAAGEGRQIQLLCNFFSFFFQICMASFALFVNFKMDIWSKRLIQSSYTFGMIFDCVSNAHQKAVLAKPALGRLARSLKFFAKLVHFLF